MFEKILIANRGEIACRIISTCRRLGIRTVAVYSDADAGARHVRLADEAVHVGGSAPAESYLDIARIIAAAKATNAEAIHPGFGFLSERPAFVKAVEDAGLTFIGPSAATMEQMGAKDTAKAIMEKAGVPVVPGYHGDNQDETFLAEQAQVIGFPLMIKAAAGGGGKGMRIVREQKEFAEALKSAKRESRSAFGDDRVLLEKFVTGPRHIEFQVFGDRHGNVIHLFERECSIQRRYQKIIEETPSPFLTAEMRARMGEAAVAAAKAVNYVNAGTVEFIVGEDREFYFMEMNTRLQVEHPVTELTTDIDLVEWQLRVAAGEALPLEQQEVFRHGHAIEARLYAENPARDFLPSTGRLKAFLTPEEGMHFRLDSGVEGGDEITIHYDPMIAKLIVWHEDRKNAIRALNQALCETAVFGLTTNLSLLRRIASHPVFAAGDIDTRYIDTHLAELVDVNTAPREVLHAAVIDELLESVDAAGFDRADGFQPNGMGGRRVVLRDAAGEEHTVFARATARGFLLRDEHGERELAAEQLDAFTVRVQDEKASANFLVFRLDDEIQVAGGGEAWQLTRVHPFAPSLDAVHDEAHPGAPMPGRIVAIHVKEGDKVEAGQPLLVMEGMKMEVTVKAGIAGTIEKLLYSEGDMVEAEAPLVDIRPE